MRFNISKDDFKHWIKSLDDDYNFNDGSIKVTSNCPIATFINAVMNQECSVAITSVKTAYDVYKLPPWSTEFINLYDGLNVGKSGNAKSAKSAITLLEESGIL